MGLGRAPDGAQARFYANASHLLLEDGRGDPLASLRLSCRNEASVYLCLCRAISDKDVAAAARCGARTVGQVFKSKNCTPNCGSCIGHIRAHLDETHAAHACREPALAAAD